MARAKTPVTVADIEFDALISEDRELGATIPEYAVETGFAVSDAVIFNAESLSMVLYVTNTPVTWYERHKGDSDRVSSVVAKLEELYYKAEPIIVSTSERTYTDMVIETMTISKSFDVGYAREIPITFKKIRITEATSTTIPDSYGKSGATGTPAGTANTTDETAAPTGQTPIDGDAEAEGNKGQSIIHAVAGMLFPTEK